MNYRPFGRTGWQVSEIGFGAWAIGAEWGSVSEQDAIAALHASLDNGVNFIDTADVYGDGRSERLISKVLKERSERIYVASKAGRRLNPHVPEGFTKENLTKFIERSLRNLDLDALDLVQLHCPPYQIYYMPEVFGYLDDLVTEGKLRFYGVSVEKVEEALKALGLIMIEKAFGKAGDRVIVEDKLEGEEASILAITDGKTILQLPTSQDHKAALDDDKGPNTGGMGAYSPVPAADAFDPVEAETAIDQATREADSAGIHGPEATPWLLRRADSWP